jgi:hypothetical protein
MTFRLKWRGEDLTFRTCRERTAFELETYFGLSNGRHQLGNFSIESTDLPRAYIDSSQKSGEITFGVGDAWALAADRWYTLTYRFAGRLGTDEQLFVDASRGYRLSPCLIPPFDDAACVGGWTDDSIYGPAERINIYNWKAVGQGTTLSWSYPARSTLINKILRHPDATDAYLLDSAGVRHWIPDGGTYLCLTNRGIPVVNEFAGINQRWNINSFTQGVNATCTPPTVRPTVTLAQGPVAPSGYRYAVTLAAFTPGSRVTITCHDSVSPGGFYTFSLVTNAQGGASTASYCYSADGPDHWVIAGGIESNHVRWGGAAPSPTTYPETTGGAANTWTNYLNAGGFQGPTIPAFTTVQIACKVTGFRVADGNTWWYRIAQAPWSNQYYVSADAFYNNGQTSGSLIGTPFVDPVVPTC